MKKSNYLPVLFCAVALISSDMLLGAILENSTLETRAWLAITIILIFVVAATQNQSNSSSKNQNS